LEDLLAFSSGVENSYTQSSARERRCPLQPTRLLEKVIKIFLLAYRGSWWFIYFIYSTFNSHSRRTVESVEMGSPQWELTPDLNGYYSPWTQRCPPSLPVMAQTHQMAQASVPLARPSWPPAFLPVPATIAKLSYFLATTPTPQLMALLSYSHPPQPQGGSTTPLASLRTPLDCMPPTQSQQIGGPAALWALPPITQVSDLPSACLEGWMAPSPARVGVSTPSSSPQLYDPKGGGIPPSDPTKAVYLMSQVVELAHHQSTVREPA
jgi:hypothetical protein